MKIIISHDVDHLEVREHRFRDLIILKIYVRSFIQLIKREISVKTFGNRILIGFKREMNNLSSLLEYDEKHGIQSTFFFGMNNGFGMNYKQAVAIKYILKVRDRGFDVGVHGIDYDNFQVMLKEYNDFKKLTDMDSFGIRNHYVRYNNYTFSMMNQIGYLYDSTEFDKEGLVMKNPYKIGRMWEFPLLIMDAYSCKEKWELAVENVIKKMSEAEQNGIEYFTILFHDDNFNKGCYPDFYQWYKSIIEYSERKYQFISYREAIEELEAER